MAILLETPAHPLHAYSCDACGWRGTSAKDENKCPNCGATLFPDEWLDRNALNTPARE